jgi:serine/threonine-protein kinase HipA
VPNHQLLPDRAGRLGLLVERFDRVVVPDGPLRRLPQEDACQVLGRYPAAKYRLTFQEVAAGLASAVEAAGGSRPLALRRLLETAAFSYVIGNGDLHGKNLSIRQGPSGLWEVTPAYDLVSTQPYLGWQDPMSLPMYGRANRLTRRWWLDAAQRLGLAERAMVRSLDRIVAGSSSGLERLPAIGYDEPTTSRLRELIAQRCDELAG